MARAAQNSTETAPPPGRPFVAGTDERRNAGGRPKGLARRVREVVGEDGLVVAQYMASVMSDPTQKTSDRIEAAKWLADRGWGKAPSFAPVEDEDPLDLTEQHLDEMAQSFDQKMDELAQARKRREGGKRSQK